MDLNTKEQILLDKIVQNTASTSLTADNLALDVSVDGLEGLQTATNTKLDTLETTLTAIETDAAALEVLQTATNSKLDHLSANQDTLEATLTAIETDAAAIEALLTAANVDHAAIEVLLTGIDADTDAIKTDIAALEVLSTAANVDLAAMEVLLTAANVDHAANEVLLTAIDADTSNIADNTSLLRDAVYIDDADWSDGSSKHMLTGGVYRSGGHTITDGDTGPFAVDSQGRLQVELSPTDNAVLDAMVVDLAAIEVLLTAANVDHAANEVLLASIDNDLGAIRTAVSASAVDDAAIEVLLTAANVDHAANEVLLTAIDAVLDTIKVDTQAIEVAVESVDASITSIIKQEDAAHSNGDRGIMALAVSQTTPARFGADGDYSPLSTNASGALYTMNVAGQMGSILVNDTTAVTCGVTAATFVAIYMLTDTVFNSGAGGLSSAVSQSFLDDTETSTNIDADAGTAIDGITFPAGMTLYGKYNGFTLASGSVIAYVG